MITFKGISAESTGVIFESLPAIPIGAPRHRSITVPGRDGSLTIEDDSREPIQIQLTGVAIDADRKALSSWLSGAGRLVFSEEPDRFLDARVVEVVELKQEIRENYAVKVMVIFEAQPYYRLLTGLEQVAVDGSSITLHNQGNLKSYPEIKLFGSGTLEVRQSGVQIMTISDVIEYIEIDSQADLVHKGMLSWESKTIGNCPVLGTGQTTLTVTGATHIEVIPNWRIR